MDIGGIVSFSSILERICISFLLIMMHCNVYAMTDVLQCIFNIRCLAIFVASVQSSCIL